MHMPKTTENPGKSHFNILEAVETIVHKQVIYYVSNQLKMYICIWAQARRSWHILINTTGSEEYKKDGSSSADALDDEL